LPEQFLIKKRLESAYWLFDPAFAKWLTAALFFSHRPSARPDSHGQGTTRPCFRAANSVAISGATVVPGKMETVGGKGRSSCREGILHKGVVKHMNVRCGITARCWLAGVLTAVGLAASSFAQEPLEDRVGRLEQQNEELRRQTGILLQQNQALMQRLGTPEQSPVSVAPPMGEAEIRSVVSSVLAEGDGKQKEAPKAAPQEEWLEVGKNLDMSAVWRHGVWLESKDKAFRFHPGGRVQTDFVWLDADNDVQQPPPGGVGPIRDGVNFRRARFAMEGTFWEVVDFNTEWDFINTADVDPTNPATQGDVINTPAPTDLWMQLTQIPVVGTARVGNMKPPIGFEHLTSSRFLHFLERSLAFDAFIGGLDNGFRPGAMILNNTEDENLTWQLGVFKSNTTVFGWNQGDGEYDITGRVTWTPYYEDNGRHMVHLGLGASHRDLDEDRLRLRARTLLRNGPGPLHTPLLNILLSGDDQTIVVPEFAMTWGPWTVQSEYFAVWVTDATFPATGAGAVNHGTGFFQSAYVEVLYFLTGEYGPYNRKGGSGAAFTRVIPHSNWFCVRNACDGLCHSWGAWQVGARYSWIDLNDKGINGGVAHDVTLGLNWYLNPNLKVQWNYSIADRDVNGASDGIVHGFGMRTAFDF
jgi:phosphate-selective porin OprO/OprP